jgi:hypothetical protein
MIEYDIDVKPVQDKLSKILEKIEAVKTREMPVEFLDWQAEDLNRRLPRIDERTPTTVMTKIHEKTGSYRLVRVAGRRRRVRTRSRPILRPVLFQELCQRMRRMLGTISWR